MCVITATVGEMQVYAYDTWLYVDGLRRGEDNPFTSELTTYEFLWECLSIIRNFGGIITYKGEFCIFQNVEDILRRGRLEDSDVVVVNDTPICLEELQRYRNEW
jgi:hypothetical protein